jgi:hypothetical protein
MNSNKKSLILSSLNEKNNTNKLTIILTIFEFYQKKEIHKFQTKN